MKKTIFAVMLALVLTFALCALPAFADTDEIVSEATDAVEAVSEGADDAVSAVEENIEDAVDSIAAVTEPAVDLGVDTVEENIDVAAAESIDLDAAIDTVDADALMENGVNDITGQDALVEETSWLNGTSGIIAIIVAAVILVAAVIAIVVLAPKKGKQK